MTNSHSGLLSYPETSSGSLLHNVVLFARVLRNAGVEVGATQVHDFAHAFKFLDVGKRHEVKDAARCLFVRRREDLAIFDRAFDLYWRRRSYDPAAARSRSSVEWTTQQTPTARLPFSENRDTVAGRR